MYYASLNILLLVSTPQPGVKVFFKNRGSSFLLPLCYLYCDLSQYLTDIKCFENPCWMNKCWVVNSWVGQKLHSSFSITSYRKIQTKILGNPVVSKLDSILVGYKNHSQTQLKLRMGDTICKAQCKMKVWGSFVQKSLRILGWWKLTHAQDPSKHGLRLLHGFCALVSGSLNLLAVNFFFNYIRVLLIYKVVLLSSIQQTDSYTHTHTYIYIYPFFSRFLFLIRYYKVFSRILCAIQ